MCVRACRAETWQLLTPRLMKDIYFVIASQHLTLRRVHTPHRSMSFGTLTRLLTSAEQHSRTRQYIIQHIIYNNITYNIHYTPHRSPPPRSLMSAEQHSLPVLCVCVGMLRTDFGDAERRSRLYAYVYVYIHTKSVYIYICICIYVQILEMLNGRLACIHMNMYIYTHVYVYMYICICTYIHIYMSYRFWRC